MLTDFACTCWVLRLLFYSRCWVTSNRFSWTPTVKFCEGSNTARLTTSTMDISNCNGYQDSVQNIYSTTPSSEKSGNLQRNRWHLLNGKHWLFCGDTSIDQFSRKVPKAALGISILSSDQWKHKWMFERVKANVIFKLEDLDFDTLLDLILRFSKPGEVVVLPWLPLSNTLRIVAEQDRIVCAGDADLRRCQEAISRAGFSIEEIRI